jgi:hypothetical protein
MFTGTTTKKWTSYPKEEWSYKLDNGKFSNPLKDTLLIIFTNPGFNLITYLEIMA